MREPAAQMPHQRLAELDEPGGDAAAVHQFAREHEERQRHQREAVHAVVEVAVQQRDVAFLAVEPQQQPRRQQERDEHRQADQQEDQEEREEKGQHQSVSRLSEGASVGGSSASGSTSWMIVRRISSKVTTASRTTPTKSEAYM